MFEILKLVCTLATDISAFLFLSESRIVCSDQVIFKKLVQ